MFLSSRLPSTDPRSLAASAAQASLDLRQEALAQAIRLSAANPDDPMASALLGESQAAVEHYPEAAATFAQSWSRHQMQALQQLWLTRASWPNSITYLNLWKVGWRTIPATLKCAACMPTLCVYLASETVPLRNTSIY